MRDTELLQALLASETETDVIKALDALGLLEDKSRWRYLGNMPNNQSIVLNQQSTPAAALVEKFTNAQDALLMRYCKAAGIDPRSEMAPASMSDAVDQFLGGKVDAFSNPDSETKARDARRAYAEDNLVLYATGTKSRPSLSLYDAGEGQLAKDFSTTFCSLIFGDASGSYKGAINFVQGRFNMGSSGVLPFCSEKHRMQLIVSRVPMDVAGGNDHEWGFTLICFFPSPQNPSWHYLVGSDKQVMTAGKDPLGLLPRANPKSGELTPPRERKVESGSLVKMYDFKAPLSNICGELFRKIEEFLLRPPLPLRLVECRKEYKANVMRNTVWDRLATWGKDRMEPGFESGASVSVQLETGETIPVEIYVYKAVKKDGELQDDPDRLQTGLRAIINGQSHAKRDTQFFKTQAVDKEHIAGSMLVLLDCTKLNQASRNALFMSNRETFREDPLLTDLFKKVQRELKSHEGLIDLNNKRYEEKVKDAVNDEDGVKALEELLATDPDLADLFGTMKPGKAGSKIVTDGPGGPHVEPPKPFKGLQYPTFFKRKDGATLVETDIEKGELGRVSFLTDVRNDYFTRKRGVGQVTYTGDIVPTTRLFNGRYTMTFAPDKKLAVGTKLNCQILIKDSKGSGPFKLDVQVTVTEPVAKEPPKYKPPTLPKALAAPSRPDIKEVKKGPDAQPLTIDKVPNSDRLRLLLNVESNLLVQAKELRPPEEAAAVEFVFKYGLALTAMGLIDAAKKTPEWETDQPACRQRIEQTAIGIARVIVPLCLSLPSKLPKKKAKLATVA
ncbi:MAG: hypothetical protein WA210_16215 [Burkholderiaceae bacterium]